MQGGRPGEGQGTSDVFLGCPIPGHGAGQRRVCVCAWGAGALEGPLVGSNLVLQRNGRFGTRRLRFMCRLHVILAQTL